jgi:predicted dehydrogenase
MHRRTFLQSTAAAGLLVSASASGQVSPNDRISVCVMGVRGRGGSLLSTFASLPEVDIDYVCDIDQRTLASRIEHLVKNSRHRPQAIGDYRRALDDSAVDALVIGTPDHWHALPTIHACQANKDVYVEKPDGHNVLESRTMVAAAKKYGRVVQLGTQGRSGRSQRGCMDYIASGKLGKVRFAKAWESSRQGNIGFPPDGNPPLGVDYDRWLGPAPKRPFNPRRFHGSWRWFFDYGAGDLGNDGVHLLDFARWGLETAVAAEGNQLATVPPVISAHGGKYYFDDAQEWPDTMMVTYDYSGYLLTYELRIWTPYRMHGEAEGAAIYGDNGYVTLGHDGFRAFDAEGKQVAEQRSGHDNVGHAQNFLDCMRSRERPVADLETVGHPSSLLCHLGNAAWRAGHTLKFDAENYTFIGDDEANQFLTRPEYRKPWLLPAIAEL